MPRHPRRGHRPAPPPAPGEEGGSGIDPRTRVRGRVGAAPETPGEAVTGRIAGKAEALRGARRPKQLLLAFAAGACVAFGVALAVAFAVAVSSGIPRDGPELPVFGLAFASGFVFVLIGEGPLATGLHAAPPLVMYRVARFPGIPVDYGDLLVRNPAPVTLGNAVGGAVFVGSLYDTHVIARRRPPG